LQYETGERRSVAALWALCYMVLKVQCGHHGAHTGLRQVPLLRPGLGHTRKRPATPAGHGTGESDTSALLHLGSWVFAITAVL
jgi:hypothetical protein